jgi:ribosome-associated heat shock protein Hsp15
MSQESEAPESLRIDKWLWHARFLKSRGLASKLVSDGKMRINGERYTKPGKTVRPEDVLTFTLQDRIRVVRIIALGERRGPAPEAQALYEDMSPPPEPKPPGADRPREKWDGNRDKPRFDTGG